MPILKLHLENVGPFDKLELDLTDGKGKAHLGPHILAGVNGSGKTTVLRAIARCVAPYNDDSGFDRQGFKAFLFGRTAKRIELDHGARWPLKLNLEKGGLLLQPAPSLGCVATYAPRPALEWMERPPLAVREDSSHNFLSFNGTVSNDIVQAYWVSSFSRESLAKSHGRENGAASTSVEGLQRAITEILGEQFSAGVDIDNAFVQPCLLFEGRKLNFSQLASGFNATIGWVVDYLWRRDTFDWPEALVKSKPGLLLIDEIETHLHPQWQRRILNGIRAAFPNTQIIVTTHSPFVVSSCPEARVHVLKLDALGKAHLSKSIDHPEGASVATTIRGVFDIASQYGPEIEGKLREWNELKKRDHVGKLSAKEKAELKGLTKRLAARGEELALLVHEPVLSRSIIEELIETASKHR